MAKSRTVSGPKRFIIFPHRMIVLTQRLHTTIALDFLSDLVFLHTAQLLWYQKGGVPLCSQRKSIIAKWPAPWPHSFSPCLSLTGQILHRTKLGVVAVGEVLHG